MGVAVNISKMAASSSRDTGGSSATVAALVALADYCLTIKPQQVKEAVQCFYGALSLSPPLRVEAKIKLQLGLTLYHHTNNLFEAREALEHAMLLTKSIAGLEHIRYEASSLLSRIHMEQGYAHNAKVVLKSALETSHHLPYWHCRLLLQKADIHVYEKDIDNLMSTLTQAADYAHHVVAPRTRILCLLSKGAHLLIHKRYQEAASILSFSCSLVEQYDGPHVTQLKTFYMIIQVTHLLGTGLLKTAKPHLKQLQQCVKLLNSEESVAETELSAESFEWFDKEQTYVLVHLVCIMHWVLMGHCDRALSFAKKAMHVVEHRKVMNNSVMAVFEVHLLELIITITLMQGDCTKTGQKLQEVINVCHGHPQLMYSHRAVLHTLLGVYAFATDNNERSVAQFQTALQHTNSLDLKVFININMAISYMKIGESKYKELKALMESLQSHDVNSLSAKNLKSALTFLKGLHAFHEVKLHEAKRFLREALSISNSNDFNKLTAFSLLLLGQIFFSLGSTKESKETIDPAFQLAVKLPDKRLQVWIASLLVELHHTLGNVESKHHSQLTLNAVQSELAKDCHTAKHSQHHSLIQWTVGDWPIRNVSKECDMGNQKDHEANSSMVSSIDYVAKQSLSKVTENIDVPQEPLQKYKCHQSHVHKQTGHMTPQTSRVSPQTGYMIPQAEQSIPQVDCQYTYDKNLQPDYVTSKMRHMTSPQQHDMTPQLNHMTSPAHHINQAHHIHQASHIKQACHINQGRLANATPQTDPLTVHSHITPPQLETPPIDYVAQKMSQEHSHRRRITPDSSLEKQSQEQHLYHGLDPFHYNDKKRPRLESDVPFDPILTRIGSPQVKNTPPPPTGSYSSSVLNSPSYHLTPPPSSNHDQSSSKQNTLQSHFRIPTSSSPSTSSNELLPSVDSVMQYPSPSIRHNESSFARGNTIPSVYKEQSNQLLHHKSSPLYQNPSPLHQNPTVVYQNPSPIYQTPQQRLGPHQSPQVLHQGLPIHQTSHQLGSYYHHITSSFTDPFHQYGYSALSPEAILRQRNQQQQTYGNIANHPMMTLPDRSHVLRGGTQLPPVGYMYQQPPYYHTQGGERLEMLPQSKLSKPSQ